MRKSKRVLMATSAVFATLIPAMAMAQTVKDNQIETVVVTARKRSEDSLKVPVAVTALTAQDVAKRGIETLDDVSKYTPGLTIDQSIGGTARSDRSFQQTIVRGLTPSTYLNPTTSVFINGTPVASSDFLQNLTDVDSVEVLKGPQSAYFGRETFAGAVNVTAKPAGNSLTGELSMTAGSRNTENFSGAFTVPIIADKLSIRAGYGYNTHDGSYKNAFDPTHTLGDQTTKSGHIAITARPIDNLTIKAFGLIFEDDDGPPATGLLLAVPGSAFNQGNCTVSGVPYFCGTLPGLRTSQSPAQVTTISPTVNFANLSAAFLANRGGILSSGDQVNGFGLKRRAYHADVSVQYDVPSVGLSFTYLGAVNRNNWDEISDLAQIDGAPGGQYPGYPGFAYEVQNQAHDFSHEVRASTDVTKPYRLLLGASYVEAFNQGALGVTQYGVQGVQPEGATLSQTSGVFFSVAYDVLPQLTINFDGRYQQDKENTSSASGVVLASATSSNFLPRVSVQYKITPDMMSYFTYSEGVNPGTFNTQYSSLPAASQRALTALGLAGGLIVKPENITNYELGFKGKLLGGRATISADIYYDKWTNQLVSENYNFAANDPANPFNVVGSATYVPNNISIDPYGYTDNSASSTAKGLEVEANFILFDHVTANLAGAINDTRYDKYLCTNCLPIPQTPGYNASGKYLPNAPKDSFAGGLEYSSAAPMFNKADWFIRGDYIYKEGVYIQASNLTKTPDINLVNLRSGLNWSNVSAEVYVNNVFNNKSYVSGFQSVNFSTGISNALMMGLPQLITGGVRLKIKY